MAETIVYLGMPEVSEAGRFWRVSCMARLGTEDERAEPHYLRLCKDGVWDGDAINGELFDSEGQARQALAGAKMKGRHVRP